MEKHFSFYTLLPKLFSMNKEHPRLLVCCEFSQRVTAAFLEKGFDAYSNDIIDCEGPFPERHLKMDARKAYYYKSWDIVIAHPPCTYLTAASAVYMHRDGQINPERYEKMLEARDLFMFFWNFVKEPLCIENPRPLHLAALPRETQVVDPTFFGDQKTKRTCLWLKNLPPLLPIVAPPANPKSYIYGTRGGHKRSLISPFLAQAMADQWAPLFL